MLKKIQHKSNQIWSVEVTRYIFFIMLVLDSVTPPLLGLYLNKVKCLTTKSKVNPRATQLKIIASNKTYT